MFKVEVDGNQDGGVVRVRGIVPGSKGSVFGPICLFEISLGDVAFSPSFDVFDDGGSQGEV